VLPNKKKCKFRVSAVSQFLVFFINFFPKYKEGNQYRESDGSALRALAADTQLFFLI
jgi:hypothetical protein